MSVITCIKSLPRWLVGKYNQVRTYFGLSEISSRKQRHYQQLINHTLIIGGLIIILPIFFSAFPASMLSLMSISLAIVSISLAIFAFTQPDNWYPQDVEHIIITSEPEDWEYQELGPENGIQYVYKHNRDIVLKYEPYSQREPFEGEDWIRNYMDETAYKRELEITHRGRRLDKEYIVQVDGGSDDIPIPSRFDLTISEYEYELGRVLNCSPAEGLARDLEALDREYHQALYQGGISESSDAFQIDWNKRHAT